MDRDRLYLFPNDFNQRQSPLAFSGQFPAVALFDSICPQECVVIDFCLMLPAISPIGFPGVPNPSILIYELKIDRQLGKTVAGIEQTRLSRPCDRDFVFVSKTGT